MQARKGGLRAAFFLGLGLALQAAAPGEGWATLVVRCPGPPVLYTSSLSAAEAQARGCERLHAAPVAVGGRAVRMASPPAGPTAATAAAASVEASSAPGPRVSADVQRQRDQDARQILQAELARELERYEALRRASAAKALPRTEPEQRAQTEALLRVEADIDAIRRELQRLR